MASLTEFLRGTFSPSGFVPRRVCGNWPEWLVWEHVAGNASVWLAYMAVPFLIWRLGVRRPELSRFSRVIWPLAAFIGLCGLGHFLDMLAFFRPLYRLSGHVLVVTGLASWWSVLSLRRAWPALLAAKGPAEFERELAERTEALARANDDLRASEQRFRRLADAIPQIVWTARPDGQFDYYNARWYDVTGAPRDQGGDAGWAPVLHPDDVRRSLDAWHASVRTGEPYQIEYRFKDMTAGGAYRWKLGRALAVRDESGRVTHWVGTCTDIDDRKRAEEALRGSEERQRRAFEAARLAHWEWDLASGRVSYTDGLPPLYGLAWGAPVEQAAAFFDAIHPDDRPGVEEAVARATGGGGPFETEFRVSWPDGSTHWLAGRGAAFFDDSGAAVRLVGVNIDVTARKDAEARVLQLKEGLEQRVRERTLELSRAAAAAEAATQAKGAFLAHMSHEIRTPMNGILGMSYLLLDTPLDGEQRGYATAIQASAEALLAVVNDILDLAKIEAGKVTVEVAPFDPRALVNEVTWLLGPVARQKGIDLTRSVAPEVPDRLLGDAGKVRQILNNLIANAVKFTDAGSVTVEASLAPAPAPAGNRVVLALAVRDTGIGIAPEDQAAIFDRFTQVDPKLNRRFGGTGLGLTICRDLAELMRGRITLESLPGRGSTFRVEVPLGIAPTARGVGANPRTRWAAPLAATLNVLLVEDHEVNRQVCLAMLDRLGCRSEAAADGHQALAALGRTPGAFDVVLMDVQMPGLDGLGATAEVRRREAVAGGHVPIIGMTANARTEDRDACLRSGMDDYLAKPVHPQALREALLRWGRVVPPGPPWPPPGESEVHRDEPPVAPAIDLPFLRDCCDDDDQLVAEVVAAFLRATPPCLGAIGAALREGDVSDVDRQTHSLLGASRTVGAVALAEGCVKIAAYARQQDASRARSTFLALLEYWENLWPSLVDVPGVLATF